MNDASLETATWRSTDRARGVRGGPNKKPNTTSRGAEPNDEALQRSEATQEVDGLTEPVVRGRVHEPGARVVAGTVGLTEC
jgi:hypothetical protein